MSIYIEEIFETELTEDGILIERYIPMDIGIADFGVEIWHYDIFETFIQEMILNLKYQLK